MLCCYLQQVCAETYLLQSLSGGQQGVRAGQELFFFKTESGQTKSENVSIYSGNGKLVVWVGGLDSWDPLMKGIVTSGHP